VAATPSWVPVLFGEQWDGVVYVIPPACLHLMVMGSISVALLGFLWAVGEAGAVLRSALAGLPLMFAVMIPLLILIGAPAVGFGWIALGLGEGTVMIRAARRHCSFHLTSRLAWPTLFAALGAGAGWTVSSQADHTLLVGALGALLATGIYLGALWLFHRHYLLDFLQLLGRGGRTMLRGTQLKPSAPVGEV
jgi:hypothetical protein